MVLVVTWEQRHAKGYRVPDFVLFVTKSCVSLQEEAVDPLQYVVEKGGIVMHAIVETAASIMSLWSNEVS